MSDKHRNKTSGRDPEVKSKKRPSTWKPVCDGHRLSLPIDWFCSCEALLGGNKSCPKCGRVPMDHVATPKPREISLRQWRKFGKQN